MKAQAVLKEGGAGGKGIARGQLASIDKKKKWNMA